VTDFALEVDPGWLREAEFLFALSRRHAMPFSVVAVHVRLVGSGARRGRLVAVPTEPEVAPVEQRIAPLLRGTDVLVECGEAGRYLVFCSGTDAQGAAEMSRRLRHDVPGVSVATGCASFGEDGLTLADLIAHAASKLPTDHREDGGDDGPSGPGDLRVVAHGHGSARKRVPGWRRRWSQRIKRAFDLSVVVVTAPFWLTTFGVVALAIKLSDVSAPVLFVQTRTGRGGRRFPMFKFRTMVPDAEALKEKLRDQNELKWPDFKIKQDPRITRIGRILRKTSLDELPQLFNVLRGDMSLVGPRPTSFEPGTYEPWQTARLEVPPGVTGLWQVEGRAATKFDERIRIELDYIERQSFLLDLWILVRTVPAVLQMRGGH
jgi:lipopolysaccharide/colanic/teichoic acid biosynthesis glycosyltransferase